ncbi:znii2cys6 transcription factor [Trichoderma arundinaceum]|uniref:Znii2cys6 transcription factor n=1 Tax=Trichoderma arundinaceum TaxID=490622 RepID=A0A395NF23_TRIAR|nr:znii2cys6 transcription factor [Trichoderma arundinaceum]
MAPAPPPPDSVSVGGIPAGYGRSCTNCSRAKCRCILRPDGGKCDRCHRLGKECQQMVTSRKRVAKRTTASRTAQLEEKLDDLVSILRATQQQQQQQHQHHQHQHQPQQQQQHQHHVHHLQQPPSAQPPMNSVSACDIASSSSSSSTCQPFVSRLDSLADAATTSQSQPRSHLCGISTPRMLDSDRLPEPTPSEAEVYLVKFRQWLEFFPFMHLGPEITAEALHRDYPFLWLCIMNVTSMSMPQQAVLRERIRQEVAQRMIVNHERSLEMLQGLIALTSCCIIYELGLTKFPNEEHYSTICFKAWGGKSVPQAKERTMEERRVVLSFWFVTSVCSAFLGKMETLVWTHHMQESLEIMESEKEYPSDETLVSLVKLQLVGEEARKLIVCDFVGRDFGRTDPDKPPTYVFKRSLLLQLQKIRETLPPGAASKALIQMHLFSTETQILSVGLFGGTRIPDTPRIDAMYASLLAARAWYETLFSVPLTDFVGMPFPIYVELSQIHALLYRLTTVEDPVWDKEIVRNTADLGTYLERTVDLFTKAEALYPLRGGPEDVSIFGKCTKVLRNVRTTWEPALTQHLGGLPTPNSQIVPGAAPQPPMLVDHSMMPDQELAPDFSDVNWMTQVFGPWDF